MVALTVRREEVFCVQNQEQKWRQVVRNTDFMYSLLMWLNSSNASVLCSQDWLDLSPDMTSQGRWPICIALSRSWISDP